MLPLFLLACFVVASQAMVCPPNMCERVSCSDVSACNGRVKPNGGFCGCCDSCVHLLGENENCALSFLMGVPSTSECGQGLHCNLRTRKCIKSETKVVPDGPCTIRNIQMAETNHIFGSPPARCNPDGSFHPVQCQGSICFCVDVRGVEIQGYKTPIGSAIETKNCQCARDKDTNSKTNLLGQSIVCQPNGNYQKYKCIGSVCFCADNNGNKVGTNSVSIGLLATLKC